MEPDTPYARIARPRRSFMPFIVVVAIIVAGIVGISYTISLRFHMTGTTPGGNALTPYVTQLNLNFNRELEANKTATPVANQNIILSSNVSGKSITIRLNTPLRDTTTYTITLAVVQAKDGSQLHNIKFVFRPTNTPFDKLSKKQQQDLIATQDHYPAVNQDPILGHLPYSTLDFNLDAVITKNAAGKEVVEIDATLLPSAADLSNEAAAIAQYKQEVVNYIKSLGVDPNNYTINYTVTQPTT